MSRASPIAATGVQPSEKAPPFGCNMTMRELSGVSVVGGPETGIRTYRGTQFGQRMTPGGAWGTAASETGGFRFCKTFRNRGHPRLLTAKTWRTLGGGLCPQPCGLFAAVFPAVRCRLGSKSSAGARRDPSANRPIEEVLDRSCIPSAAARSEDAAPVEFRGYPMKACRPFAADGFDYRQDAAHMRIRLGLHGRDGVGVPEAAERACTIRVA